MRVAVIILILCVGMVGLTACGGKKEPKVEEAKQPETAQVEEKQKPVAVPVFVLAAGTYEGEQTLTIETEEDTKVYYTTDGSDPSTDDLLYEGPFPLLPGRYEIRAVAINSAGAVSEPVISQYDIKAPEAPKPVAFKDAIQGLWGHLDENGAIVLYLINGSTLQVGFLQSEWQGPYVFDVVEPEANAGLLRIRDIAMDCHIDLGVAGDNKITLQRSTPDETFAPVELLYISGDDGILQTHSGANQIREKFAVGSESI